MSDQKRSFDELLNQSEVKDWLFRAEREMFPKMEGAAISLVISSEKPDAKLALEVGAAILFGKPLIIVHKKGETVPVNLRRVASAVVEIDDFQSPEGQRKLIAALESARAKLDQGERLRTAGGKD